MNLNKLPENINTKTIIRQEEDYVEAGVEGRREVPLPFTLEHINEEAVAALGFVPPGIVRALNQVLVENTANIHGAQVRAAIKKNQALPDINAFRAILESYDFSGVRASSEAGMPEEERIFRTQLKKQIKALLRQGVFSANGEDPLTVQTKPEVDRNELPAGKIALEAFETLVETAAEGVSIELDGVSYDFSGEPSFDEVGNFENFAAITAFAHELADKEMELSRISTGRTINASMPK